MNIIKSISNLGGNCSFGPAPYAQLIVEKYMYLMHNLKAMRPFFS